MSYNVNVYLVDSKKIEAIEGSKDDAFLKSFRKKNKLKLKELYYYFEDDIKAETVEECLNNIVYGKVPKYSEYDYIYAYLYELISQKFGRWISVNPFLDGLYYATKKNNHTSFINIPKNSGFPEYYSVKYENLEETKKMFLAYDKIKHIDAYNHYIKTIEEIFSLATKKNKDLVFFCY